MRTEVKPGVIVVVAIIMVALLAFFFMRSMAPHETIKDNPNATIGFQGRLKKLQEMQGKAGAIPNAPTPDK